VLAPSGRQAVAHHVTSKARMEDRRRQRKSDMEFLKRHGSNERQARLNTGQETHCNLEDGQAFACGFFVFTSS
jgi:hypothetical protein